MQTAQLRQQISNIEQCIDAVIKICQTSPTIPDNLRDCLIDLESESDQAKQLMQTEYAEQEIRNCIKRLENLGDHAIQACMRADYVDHDVENALSQAYDAISLLNRQLH